PRSPRWLSPRAIAACPVFCFDIRVQSCWQRSPVWHGRAASESCNDPASRGRDRARRDRMARRAEVEVGRGAQLGLGYPPLEPPRLRLPPAEQEVVPAARGPLGCRAEVRKSPACGSQTKDGSSVSVSMTTEAGGRGERPVPG